MDVISVAASIVGLLSLALSVGRASLRSLQSLAFYTRQYGSAGILLQVFGNSAVWKMQLQVLATKDGQTALDFKAARQKESDTVAIAGSILAQIAITSLSLSNLSQAHWTARAFFAVSLVASVISVYYASTQQKTLGRLLKPEDIKTWIRKKEPNSLEPAEMMPSAAAVLIVSAPNALLSMAVHALLIGLGIYLGFVWTKNLDQSSTITGNRAVFIAYIVSLSVCYSIYALSNIVVADSSEVSEHVLYQSLNAAESESATTGAYPTPLNGANPEARFRKFSSEVQKVFREAAQLRRGLAALDDRIVQLCENLDLLDDRPK